MTKSPQFEEFISSFIVDARGGCIQAKRHPQLKIFVPPNAVPCPTRIVCRLLKPQCSGSVPQLNDCDGFVSRILQMHSSCQSFLKPIVIEMPHIASLRNGERQIMILRKNIDSKIWKEHIQKEMKESLTEVFGELEDFLTPESELQPRLICRIITDDVPNYLCLVSGFHRDSRFIGQEGGSIQSTVDSRIQIKFPPNALMKKIQISLEVQTINPKILSRILGDNHHVLLSPIVTVLPKRRKFRDLIELRLPLPKNLESNDLSSLKMLFSISEFETKWEDVTDSIELLMQDNIVIHSTKISARVWLIWAPEIDDIAGLANRIYAHHCVTPYIGRFISFSKRIDADECQLRLLLCTEETVSKTLENQEQFVLVATGDEVEIIDKFEYKIETAGNFVPVTKSDESIQLFVQPFMESRVTIALRMRNHDEEFRGKVAFIPNFKSRGNSVIKPNTTLDIMVPDPIVDRNSSLNGSNLDHHIQKEEPDEKMEYQKNAQVNLRAIAEEVGQDWLHFARELGIAVDTINGTICESCSDFDKALVTLITWQNNNFTSASIEALNHALLSIGRNDVSKFLVEESTNDSDYHESELEGECIWDSVLAPSLKLDKYSESVDDSMIAQSGDNWSERNIDQDENGDDSPSESRTPNNERINDSEQVPIASESVSMANEQAGTLDDQILHFLSELTKATPEPQHYNIDSTKDETRESIVDHKQSFSAIPSHLDWDLDEEVIVPVVVSKTFENASLDTVNEEKDTDYTSKVYHQSQVDKGKADSVINTDAILHFLSEMDKATLEPVLLDTDNDQGEIAVHSKMSMSGLPSFKIIDFEEEIIVPISVGQRFDNAFTDQAKESENMADDQDNCEIGMVSIEQAVIHDEILNEDKSQAQTKIPVLDGNGDDSVFVKGNPIKINQLEESIMLKSNEEVINNLSESDSGLIDFWAVNDNILLLEPCVPNSVLFSEQITHADVQDGVHLTEPISPVDLPDSALQKSITPADVQDSLILMESITIVNIPDSDLLTEPLTSTEGMNIHPLIESNTTVESSETTTNKDTMEDQTETKQFPEAYYNLLRSMENVTESKMNAMFELIKIPDGMSDDEITSSDYEEMMNPYGIDFDSLLKEPSTRMNINEEVADKDSSKVAPMDNEVSNLLDPSVPILSGEISPRIEIELTGESLSKDTTFERMPDQIYDQDENADRLELQIDGPGSVIESEEKVENEDDLKESINILKYECESKDDDVETMEDFGHCESQGECEADQRNTSKHCLDTDQSPILIESTDLDDTCVSSIGDVTENMMSREEQTYCPETFDNRNVTETEKESIYAGISEKLEDSSSLDNLPQSMADDKEDIDCEPLTLTKSLEVDNKAVEDSTKVPKKGKSKKGRKNKAKSSQM